MQLKITTDYAIRTILYLAQVERIASSAEVAEKMGIPRKYLINIVGAMKKRGLIDTHPGQFGGYSLGKPPNEISLFDIILAMEGTAKINRCLEDDNYCSRFATADCPLRKGYLILQKGLESYFQQITIADLANETVVLDEIDFKTGS